MKQKKDLKNVLSGAINTPQLLAKELKRLHLKRRKSKRKIIRGTPLKKSDRNEVLKKTDSKCHMCGQKLTISDFQADHVRAHVQGGKSNLDNFLPSCSTCNNYRWHYISAEIQWILKIGVWAKTQIENQTIAGLSIANGFIKYEARRVKNNINRKR